MIKDKITANSRCSFYIIIFQQSKCVVLRKRRTGIFFNKKKFQAPSSPTPFNNPIFYIYPMKKTLRTCLVLLILLSAKPEVKAQAAIDETNLITRLSGLGNLSAADAEKYFTDHGYTLFSKKTVPQATYSMDLYKYKITGQTTSYLLSVIADGVSGVGEITYSEDDYKDALKVTKDMGFVPSDAANPDPGKTVYAKGDVRFVVQIQSVNGKTFYVMMLSDLLKTVKLAGLKK